ncbi:ABC transporter substrate-binding protein [Pseudonocardia sp. HH130629-09]|uniref:ABC transporter substrate-binding protein n=1 Tax=Pseudonocardia sp. HH130629-09 TaxID=1641402 RepID=UPI0006CB1346|nr:ABC transporter substrate-binding protein [Pseudonocardia sp. HH130629-09]ALE84743.1 sulfonate ABC transporter substrate-binding protein [Pseudonocardia sp. HH130629-09]
MSPHVLRPGSRVRTAAVLLALLTALGLMAGCSRAAESTTAAGATSPAAEVRVGYFPNITHAPALVGVKQGLFAKELGSTKLTTQTFNAGPDQVNALLGGSIDVAFIGSGPAINAFTKSNGEAVRLVAGSTSAGAQLVTSPDITSPEQLKGKIIATPQLGNTQDIAFKTWLKENNLPIGDGPDAVTVQNIDNPQTLDLFKQGKLAGGWLPEPWSSRLVDAGAKVLVDEKSLWPDGNFPTTVVIARTEFLQQHPQTVEAILRGEQAAISFIRSDPAQAKTVSNAAIGEITGKPLAANILDRAFTELSFDTDPLASTFPQLAKDSVTAGIAQSEANLTGFLAPTAIDAVRTGSGEAAVDPAGLAAAN